MARRARGGRRARAARPGRTAGPAGRQRPACPPCLIELSTGGWALPWTAADRQDAADVVHEPGQDRGVLEGERHARALPAQQRCGPIPQRVPKERGQLRGGPYDDAVVADLLAHREPAGRVLPGAQDVAAALAV